MKAVLGLFHSRHLQRFLILPQLQIKLLWFHFIKNYLKNCFLLDKKGNSNFIEQKRLLQAVARLLKEYKIIVLRDREFGNVALADWLEEKGFQYVLRTKDNKYIQQEEADYQQLSSLGLKPGKSFYLYSYLK